MTENQTAPQGPTPITPSLFFIGLLYGGMTVIAGVLGFKQVALGPLAVEAGIFAFLMLVVLSSTTAQLHGQAMANRLVLWGFVPLAASAVLVVLVLFLPPSDKMPVENITAFETVLSQTPRIMMAGPVAYGVSLFLNVWIFSKLRGSGDDTGTVGLMVRGAIASALSQAIDTLIFITLAFYGEFPIGSLLAGQMLAKVVLSLVLVPFLITGFVQFARWLDREQA
ncbi:queuosine precursor transporter [Pontixanthobacter aestiaquae]|uniref:Probable queuosine precursor transporter n=1 Tax=Pontixanthobacter aestiaquae TaxID=1509367 RepID=A0A844Z474_9SPHN|nr:queuosine precursor transporter [Pontixanthobacter aestiaquae]MDN3646284.1 queuosine precursor transporter [Pontixanthobacter aestiaquae]MXO82725.1 queuosine precursor transporter [Pontixanthobacter aestiaquae]